MKLRFSATLRAAYWPELEKLSQDHKEVKEVLDDSNICVTFKFSEIYNSMKKREKKKAFIEIPIEIDVPRIKVYKKKLDTPVKDKKFMLDPYADKESFQRAYSIAAYVADVLQEQLTFCELLEESITPINYIPETKDDKQLLNKSLIKRQRPARFVWRTGNVSIDFQALNRYWNHQELLSIKAHGLRLLDKDPISAYRELYRIFDLALRELRGHKSKESRKPEISRKDRFLAKHTGRNPEEFRDLRDLRNRCSHAFKNFITYGKLEDLEKIRGAMTKLKEIVEILEGKLLNL